MRCKLCKKQITTATDRARRKHQHGCPTTVQTVTAELVEKKSEQNPLSLLSSLTSIATPLPPLPSPPQSRRVAPVLPSSQVDRRTLDDRGVEMRRLSGGEPVPVMANHLVLFPDDLPKLHAALGLATTSTASVVVPKYTEKQSAAVKTGLGLSRHQFQALRRLFPGALRAEKKVAAAVRAAAAPVREINYNGLSMAVTHLRAAIEVDLRANSALRAVTDHTIKIGGDASHDCTEKEERSSSILLLLFAWLAPAAGLLPNSTKSHRVLAAAWAKESHQTVQTMCNYFSEELRQLRDNGLHLMIDGKEQLFRFTFIVSGDMKWVRLAYGLGGCSSSYGCLYCRIEKKDLYTHLKDAKFGEGYDEPKEKMRSIGFMTIMAEKAAKDRVEKKQKEEKQAAAVEEKKRKQAEQQEEEKKKKEREEMEGKTVETEKKGGRQQRKATQKQIEAEKKRAAAAAKKTKGSKGKEEKKEKKKKPVEEAAVGKKVENQEWPPAWDLPPNCAPPERLHLVLCICRIFERALAMMLHPISTCTTTPGRTKQRTPTIELRSNAKHRNECLRPMGIDRRPITGYTCKEWRTIIKQPELWCRLASSHRNYNNLINSMKGFNVLHEMMRGMDDDVKAEAFGREALRWAQELSAWCLEARQSFYLHVLAQHAWRWTSLSDYSSYAMEKINSMMKKQKRRYTFDKKKSDTTSTRSADGVLTALVRIINATNVLSQDSPVTLKPKKRKLLECTACHQQGHQRNSQKCPNKHTYNKHLKPKKNKRARTV